MLMMAYTANANDTSCVNVTIGIRMMSLFLTLVTATTRILSFTSHLIIGGSAT